MFMKSCPKNTQNLMQKAHQYKFVYLTIITYTDNIIFVKLMDIQCHRDSHRAYLPCYTFKLEINIST